MFIRAERLWVYAASFLYCTLVHSQMQTQHFCLKDKGVYGITCPTSQFIIVDSSVIGTSDNATDSECLQNNQDCVAEFQLLYDVCNFKGSCIIRHDQITQNIKGKCQTTNFLHVDYSCIPETHPRSICKRSLEALGNTTILLANNGFPGPVTPEPHTCQCAIQNTNSADPQKTSITALAVNLYARDSNSISRSCDEQLLITDTTNTVLLDTCAAVTDADGYIKMVNMDLVRPDHTSPFYILFRKTTNFNHSSEGGSRLLLAIQGATSTTITCQQIEDSSPTYPGTGFTEITTLETSGASDVPIEGIPGQGTNRQLVIGLSVAAAVIVAIAIIVGLLIYKRRSRLKKKPRLQDHDGAGLTMGAYLPTSEEGDISESKPYVNEVIRTNEQPGADNGPEQYAYADDEGSPPQGDHITAQRQLSQDSNQYDYVAFNPGGRVYPVNPAQTNQNENDDGYLKPVSTPPKPKKKIPKPLLADAECTTGTLETGVKSEDPESPLKYEHLHSSTEVSNNSNQNQSLSDPPASLYQPLSDGPTPETPPGTSSGVSARGRGQLRRDPTYENQDNLVNDDQGVHESLYENTGDMRFSRQDTYENVD